MDIPLFESHHCDLASTEDFETVSANSGGHVSHVTTTACALHMLAPFTYNQSVSICVDAALIVAGQLRNLSKPNLQFANGISHRLVPTCSCSAIQAAYTLLMQLCKTQPSFENSELFNSYSASLISDELGVGVESLAEALADFAVSAEALTKMKGCNNWYFPYYLEGRVLFMYI